MKKQWTRHLTEKQARRLEDAMFEREVGAGKKSKAASRPRRTKKSPRKK